MSKVLDANPRTARIEALTRFRALLSQENSTGDREFQEIIAQVGLVLEISDQELADKIMVSRPTVNRWKNGRNLPHPLMRGPIIAWLNQQASMKIRLLSRFGEGGGTSRRVRVRAAGAGATLRVRPIAAAGKMRGR